MGSLGRSGWRNRESRGVGHSGASLQVNERLAIPNSCFVFCIELSDPCAVTVLQMYELILCICSYTGLWMFTKVRDRTWWTELCVQCGGVTETFMQRSESLCARKEPR